MKITNKRFLIPLLAISLLAIALGIVLLTMCTVCNGGCELCLARSARQVTAFVSMGAGLLLVLLLMFYYTRAVRLSRNELLFSLSHDPLTKLPNRMQAVQELELLIKQNRCFSVISIDIDDLKSINDYYSREFGDKLLSQFAVRLKTLETTDTYQAYHLSSDEFVLVLHDRCLHANDAEAYFLRQLLSEPFFADESPVFIKCSMGVAVSEGRTQSSETYLSDADLAMYEAKKQGRNKTVFFTEAMRTAVQERQRTVKDIEYACQHGGFYVMFQPQIDVKTGDIYGYEALARLKVTHGTEERLIPPIAFIPAAEKSGYITKIGRIVTEQAIKHMVEWRKNGFTLHKVSINYSVGQMTDKGYVNYLSDLLEENAISPDLICIEITESLFLENRKQAMELFDQFRAIGVQLALDDFGTGYSSLSYLAYLPVSTIKIDKSMIDTYLSQEDKSQFIQNIVNLVHSLDMALTVEGIEERWQYDKICEFGGDHIQGYFFSKPLMADKVESFVPALPSRD